MDEDILNTVHSIFGKNVEIVDCVKTSSVQEEELVFVNGIPVKLEAMAGDGNALKTALLEGQVPSVDILNQLLQKAGLLQQSVQLETSLSIKSTLTTTEDVKISRHGRVLEQQTSETKEDFIHHSNSKDILQPVSQEKCPKVQHENFRSLKSNNNKKSYSSSTSSSTIVDSHNDISSNISNYSTNTFSSPAANASPSSSSSCITNSKNQSGSNFNAYQDYCNEKKSNLSYDSGHDGDYHSVSQSAVWPQIKRETTANSLSSCYEITTSSDDISLMKLQKGCNSQISSRKNKEDATVKITDNYTRGVGANAENMDSSTADDDHTLVFRNGKLISGVLSALIEHLIPKRSYYPDADFIYIFLLCGRIFIKPAELLANIGKMWQSQKSQFDTPLTSVNNLKQLLKDWLEYFPRDFQDDLFNQELRLLCMKHQTLEDSFNAQLAKSHINTSKNYESESQLHVVNHGLKKAMTLPKSQTLANVCENPIDAAHQLTVIELEYLSNIGSEEFLQIFEKDFKNYITNAIQLKTVLPSANKYFTLGTNESNGHLTAYIRWFNRLSFLTATEILKFPKKKQRARIIEYWIETARECFNLGNFNSVMAILIGLNLSPISRLKKTWSKVKSAKFTALEHQMDPTSNFDSYRSTMKAAVWRSECATQQRERIIIPFFTLLLKDLYHLSENIRSKLPNNHINYENCSKFAEQIRDFNRWKTLSCPYEKISKIVDLLKDGLVFDEETLIVSSFSCEPPVNSDEKELFKQFKTKINL